MTKIKHMNRHVHSVSRHVKPASMTMNLFLMNISNH